MTDSIGTSTIDEPRKGFSGKQVLLIVFITLLVAVAGTWFVLKYYVFLKEFSPVTLNVKEKQVLDNKLQALGFEPESSGELDSEGNLKPEKYSEDSGKREISLSEKELNALLANNTDMAKRLAIDLSDNLASAKLLIPMEEDVPLLGGKTLRINAGLGLSFANDKPVVVLKGVSVMGVPIPNAWLGNMKNVDLIQEFGFEPGFWNAFASGVELIDVEEGALLIKLKE